MNERITQLTELLLEYLGLEGRTDWIAFHEFAEWEYVYNSDSDPRLLSRLATNLVNLGLVELRTTADGTQLRITDVGLERFTELRQTDHGLDELLDWTSLQPNLDEDANKIEIRSANR